MLNGKDLRGKVDNIQELMTDIEGYMLDKDALTSVVRRIIENIKNDCEELFYMIPLEED